MNSFFRFWTKRIISLIKLYGEFFKLYIDISTIIYIVLLGIAFIHYNMSHINEYIDILRIDILNKVFSMILIYNILPKNVSTYFKLADQIFLMPLEVYGKRFMKYSLFLKVLLGAVKIGIIIMIFYYINYKPININLNELLLVYINLIILFSLYLIIKIRIFQLKNKWMIRLFNILLFGAFFYIINLYLIVFIKEITLNINVMILITFILSTYFISKKVFSKNFNWEKIIQNDSDKRIENFSKLTMTRKETKDRLLNTKKTFSFLNGSRFLKYNGEGAILLIFTRNFFRKGDYLKLIIQMIIMGVIIIPFISNLTFLIIYAFIISFFIMKVLINLFLEIILDPDLRHRPISNDDKLKSCLKAIFGVVLFYLILFSLINLIFNGLKGSLILFSILSIGFYFIIFFQCLSLGIESKNK